jgi:signal transduction histidine kinase
LAYVAGFLVAAVVILTGYLIILQLQIRNMSRQLEKRLREHTRQPVSLELINPDLNQLAFHMNKCLKAEETLRLKEIMEEKRFREMIADISHDLRTPLTAIKGYQQLLEKEELSEDQHRMLLIAEKHTKELGQLIEHFFEYSYLLNTAPKLNPERINLTNLMTECLAASITALEDRGLAVSFEDTKPIFIQTDKELITRIIQNLIRNCIQHSDGDIKVWLTEEAFVSVSVKNPVIDSKNIDVSRIFERFYTGDKARNRSTGLGLSIVRLLAQQLGGSTGASLQDGQLEIQVTLPVSIC